jgi:hypothetical protein
MDTIQIRVVSTNDDEYQQSLELRNKVLRKPLGLDIKDDDLYKEKDAFHVLALYKEKVVGTLFLLPINNSHFQMKQVAVDPVFQGKGIGKQVVEAAEVFAKERKCRSISLHARINAWPFYKRCGYQFASEEFEEKGITHKIMDKQLDI